MNMMTILTVLLSSLSLNAHAGTKELTRFKLGGEGGWDYLAVEPVARKLMIARSDRIMVIHADTGALLGEVKDLDGAHGVAWQPGSKTIFATSGKSNEVMEIDAATLKIMHKIKVGEKPDAIYYDSFSKMIFVFNGKSKNASVIDPATLKVTHTIELSGKPEFAAGDGEGRVYVNIEDKNEVTVIDSAHFKVTHQYPLSPCEEPTGMDISPVSKKLIVGCGNETSVVVNSKNGIVLQTFKTGKGVDAVAYDPVRKMAYISAGEGKLTVLKEGKKDFTLAETVTTVSGARTLAVDSKTGNVFLPAAEFEPIKPGEDPNGHSKKIKPGSFYVLVVGSSK